MASQRSVRAVARQTVLVLLALIFAWLAAGTSAGSAAAAVQYGYDSTINGYDPHARPVEPRSVRAPDLGDVAVARESRLTSVGREASRSQHGVVAAEAALTTPRVGSAKLQNIIDDLYKGTTNPGRVGTGTTADAIRYELRTGEQVFGRSHIQKGEDYARGLENWLKRNPDAGYYDRLVARSLADDLLDALGRAR